MNWKDIKNIIKKELKEATTVSAGDSKFNLRTGVNKNTICINNQLINEGHAYIYEGGKKKLLTS